MESRQSTPHTQRYHTITKLSPSMLTSHQFCLLFDLRSHLIHIAASTTSYCTNLALLTLIHPIITYHPDARGRQLLSWSSPAHQYCSNNPNPINAYPPITTGVGSCFPSLAQHIFARLHVDDVCEPTEPQFVKDLFVKEASRADFRSVMSRIRLVRSE